MKFNCTYFGGDGTEYEEGEFEVSKRTKKAIHLKRLSDGFYANYEGLDIVIPVGDGKRTAFCPAVKEYDDGEIVVYHEGRGIPFMYKPVSA